MCKYIIYVVDKSVCTKVAEDKYKHIKHLMEIKEVRERVSKQARDNIREEL